MFVYFKKCKFRKNLHAVLKSAEANHLKLYWPKGTDREIKPQNVNLSVYTQAIRRWVCLHRKKKPGKSWSKIKLRSEVLTVYQETALITILFQLSIILKPLKKKFLDNFLNNCKDWHKELANRTLQSIIGIFQLIHRLNFFLNKFPKILASKADILWARHVVDCVTSRTSALEATKVP